jgi:hypothetical protein
MTEPEPRSLPNRRLSITKLQRQSAAGADLIALCQTVTEDGSLSEEEVAGLRQWLDDHASTDLPARDYLFHTVAQIVADGRVTLEERRELYRAIETILPSDLRNPVTAKRRELEQAATDKARAEREAGKQAQREERERSRPIGSWNFMVAGVRYEGRPQVIARYASPDDVVYLIRDRENRYSRNAVEVRLSNGMQIGFVPEDYATDVAPLLNSGLPHDAFITKILTGGRSPIPVVQAYVYRADAAGAELVFEKDVPAKVPPPHASGCAVVLLLGALTAVASLVLARQVDMP